MNLVLYSYYKEESPGVWVHVIITEKSTEKAIEEMANQPFSD
jgi:hypothetical protein